MKKQYEMPVVSVIPFAVAPIVTYSLGDSEFKDDWESESSVDPQD